MRVYKVRDKKTGLFSTGTSSPRWIKSGKVWASLGNIKNHYNMYLKWYKKIPDTWEIVEFELLETGVVTIGQEEG